MRLTTLIIASALFISASANAAFHDTVKDSNGGNVITINGDCVRTVWTSAVDDCCECVLLPTGEAVQINEVKKLSVEEKVTFQFDKYKLKPEEIAKLDKIIAQLKGKNISNIKIYGYTDTIGTNQYNLTLSQKRALAVYDYIKSKIALSDDTNVDIKGMGKQDIIKSCEGTKDGSLIGCLEPNRRVEIKAEVDE